MTDKPKRKQKHIEPLPDDINEAAYRYTGVAVMGGSLLMIGLSAVVTWSAASLGAALIVWLSGILGAWLLGMRRRFVYAHRQGNAAQQLRVRAEFWGRVAYGLSVVASFVVFATIFWYLLPFISGGALAGVSAALLVIAFFLSSYWLGYQNRQRVYQNFGYDPQAYDTDDSMPDTRRLTDIDETSDIDHPQALDTRSDARDTETGRH
jgi:hypothetical protein